VGFSVSDAGGGDSARKRVKRHTKDAQVVETSQEANGARKQSSFQRDLILSE